MKWNKYTLKTTTDAVDFVSGILMEIGITNIEIEDNVHITEEEKKEMFADILPNLPPDDGTAYVRFYIMIDDGEIDTGLLNDGIHIEKKTVAADEAQLITSIKEELEELRSFVDVGEGIITKEETQDKDWMNNWKQHFKPFIVDGILIKPTWESIPEKGEFKTVIQIDPGTAFGTGMHETTQLCIHPLSDLIAPDTKLLDIGCGSGILSIIGLKLGAAYAAGTDIDENAIITAKENAQMNDVDSKKLNLYYGDILTDKKLSAHLKQVKYDVVVSNILADVIIKLAPIIPEYLKKDGYFISSGIIKEKGDEVIAAIKAAGSFEIIHIAAEGDWVGITAKHI